MSESSAKSGQALAAKQDKDVSEKRGRGRPRKHPQRYLAIRDVYRHPRPDNVHPGALGKLARELAEPLLIIFQTSWRMEDVPEDWQKEEPSEAPVPKRPRGRPKGSKNKPASKGRKAAVTPARKPRGRPKKSEKEEEEVNISQESSEEEQ